MAKGKIDPSAPVPARIHVIVARDAPYAVVIRRGPSKHVCTIGWNLTTDEFTLGQWLRGRIYERRCDISPNGKYFVYFAMKGKPGSARSYTGISRTPCLKAMGFWKKDDCWNGGGQFPTNKQYWINGYQQHEEIRSFRLATRVDACPGIVEAMGECMLTYYPRLLRDGWLSGDTELAKQLSGVHRDVAIFEKRIDPRWTLRKVAIGTVNHPVGKGCYYDEHALVDTVSGGKIDAKEWEWADIVRGRLLWSRDGAIYSGRLTKEGIKDETMLKDFNSMQFERIKAPY